MPKARKYYRKKRMYRKKRIIRKKTGMLSTIGRSISPIPQRFITKLKYSTDLSTSSTGLWRLNLNSLFDPDRSGIGHQPYGYDTLSAIYNRYRVISCGWRITCPSSVSVVQLGALPSNEDVTIVSMDYMRENPRAKYFCQNPGGQALVLSGKSYIPSLVGRTTAQYMADDQYQAQVNASPNSLAVLNLFTATATGGPLAAPLNIMLEYTVEFFDINNLAQS